MEDLTLKTSLPWTRSCAYRVGKWVCLAQQWWALLSERHDTRKKKKLTCLKRPEPCFWMLKKGNIFHKLLSIINLTHYLPRKSERNCPLLLCPPPRDTLNQAETRATAACLCISKPLSMWLSTPQGLRKTSELKNSNSLFTHCKYVGDLHNHNRKHLQFGPSLKS